MIHLQTTNYQIIKSDLELHDSFLWKVTRENQSQQAIYKGRCYTVIGRATNKHPILDQIVRSSIGVFIVIGSLGLGLLSSSVRQLFKTNAEKLYIRANLSERLRACGSDAVHAHTYGVYLVANEVNQEHIAEMLRQNVPASNTGAHVGCGGLYNLDLMCVRKPAYGVIFDFNQNNKVFIENIAEIIKSSATRQECAMQIQNYINKDKRSARRLLAWDDNTIRAEIYDNFISELNRTSSWLGSDEHFAYIKNQILKDRIIAITQDATNSESFRQIKGVCAHHNIPMDTVYVSNICDFVGKNDKDKQAFIQSVIQLVDDASLIVCAPPRSTRSESDQRSGKIPLQLLHGVDLKKEKGGQLLFSCTLLA